MHYPGLDVGDRMTYSNDNSDPETLAVSDPIQYRDNFVNDVTICFWIKMKQEDRLGTILSYGTGGEITCEYLLCLVMWLWAGYPKAEFVNAIAHDQRMVTWQFEVLHHSILWRDKNIGDWHSYFLGHYIRLVHSFHFFDRAELTLWLSPLRSIYSIHPWPPHQFCRVCNYCCHSYIFTRLINFSKSHSFMSGHNNGSVLFLDHSGWIGLSQFDLMPSQISKRPAY